MRITEHHPDTVALNERVADIRLLLPAGQHRPRFAGRRHEGKDALRHPARKPGGRPLIHKAPLIEHQHMGAALGLIHIGRRPKHRHAAHGELGHHFPQLAPGKRIDAHPRLIEQQQAGRGQQRAGKAELLLHAAGKLSRQPIRKRLQCRERQQLFKHGPTRRALKPAQLGMKVKVVDDGQIFIQTETLRHIPDITDGFVRRIREGRAPGHGPPV